MFALLLAMQQAVAYPTDARATIPAGSLTTYTLRDSSYQRERQVWVYTPAGYDARRAQPYPFIVAFDGGEYYDTMPLPRILDTLLAARRAPAFVAVLIDDASSATRIADLGNAHRMVDFLSRQLIPWVRRGWRVTTDPHRVIITGSSAGGLASAFVAFSRPDLFGNVWSQSGAFWRGAEGSNDPPYEWLTSQVKASPRKDVRFMLDVGALETHGALGGAAPSILAANRHLARALRDKGYHVALYEVPDGNHAERWWRERLPVGIVGLSAEWPRPDQPLTGQWDGVFDDLGSPVPVRLVLRQQDSLLAGRFYTRGTLYDSLTEGAVRENRFEFRVEGLVFHGTVTGDQLDIQLTTLSNRVDPLTVRRARQ